MSIALAAIPVFAAAVAQARRVDLAAYTLRPGAVLKALIVAADANARVRVRVEGDPLDDAQRSLHRANAAAVQRLAAAGADASATAAGEPILHMKAAVVDGVAWLDDRNWTGDGRDTVFRDSEAADVAAVSAALRGETAAGGAEGDLRTTKAGAQALELEVIAAAGGAPLALESESFGTGWVYNALLARGRAGAPTRLLVAGREAAESGLRGATERRLLGRLATLGIEVRTGDPRGRDFDGKLAVASAAAWAGSANATYAGGEAGEQRDWGLKTAQPSLVDGLRAAFEASWRDAHPLADGTLTAAICAQPSAIISSIHPPVQSSERRSTSASTLP